MERADILKLASDEEEKLFVARLLDQIRTAEEKYCVKYTGFLDLKSQSLSKEVLRLSGCKEYLFSEGQGFEERKLLAVFHEGLEICSFPAVFIKISSSQLSKLSHRDYLGTLMSLGIKRELTGDILTGEKESFLTVSADIADFVISSVEKIGGVGVKLEKCCQSDLPVKLAEFEEKTDSVSSLRLDGIVSSFINVSRTMAKEMIKAGYVFLDGRETTKGDKTVDCGKTVTIRGKGKFILDNAVPSKKKDRLRIRYRKYKG